MVKQFQLTDSQEIIAYLVQQFPICFTFQTITKPLKIDILRDIVYRLKVYEIMSKVKSRIILNIDIIKRWNLKSFIILFKRFKPNRIESRKDEVNQKKIRYVKQQPEASNQKFEKYSKLLAQNNNPIFPFHNLKF